MNILITGTGFPGTHSIISSLRSGLPGVRILGIDAQDTDLARLFVDAFYQAPYALDHDYSDFIIKLCLEEKVDVILPTTTHELPRLQEILPVLNVNGTRIPIGTKIPYDTLNNKWSILTICKKHKIPTPKFKLVDSLAKMLTALYNDFNYPGEISCIKPVISNGGRGFRIIDNNAVNTFYISKSDARVTVGDLLNQLPEELDTSFVLMEYLPGREYTVDCLADKGKLVYAIPRTRDYVREGISFTSTTIEHKEIISWCETIIDASRAHGAIGFQFKEDAAGVPKIIECNPRLQGGSSLCVASGADIFNDLVRLAMGQRIEKPEIKWGIRMVRYYDEKYI